MNGEKQQEVINQVELVTNPKEVLAGVITASLFPLQIKAQSIDLGDTIPVTKHQTEMPLLTVYLYLHKFCKWPENERFCNEVELYATTYWAEIGESPKTMTLYDAGVNFSRICHMGGVFSERVMKLARTAKKEIKLQEKEYCDGVAISIISQLISTLDPKDYDLIPKPLAQLLTPSRTSKGRDENRQIIKMFLNRIHQKALEYREKVPELRNSFQEF